MTINTPSSQPWFKQKKFVITLGIVVLIIIGQFTEKEKTVSGTTTLSGYEIQDNIFYDEDQDAWAWTPIFKMSLEPSTKILCDIDGLDKDGKSVVSDYFKGNVLNDGTVVYFGTKRYDTTTKEIAQSIKSYKISCRE